MGSTTYNPPLALTVRGNDGDGTPLPESWRITPHLAAEGLWTTAEDLARAIIAIQEARRNPRLSGRERPIIGPKLAAAMGSSQRGSLSWGLGLGIDGDSGYFFHEGKSAGFKNFVLFDMKGRGVVVLTNSDNGDVLYPEIVAAVAEAYAWPNRDRITAANTVSS
jgi:hypothetical protein